MITVIMVVVMITVIMVVVVTTMIYLAILMTCWVTLRRAGASSLK